MKIKYIIRWIKWFFTGTHDWNTPPNRRWKDDQGRWIGPPMTKDEFEEWFEEKYK